MLISSIISFILTIILFIIVKTHCYEDSSFTKKIKMTISFYFVTIILSLIPILGLIITFALYLFMINLIKDEDFCYKPGWFIKLMNKKL